MQRRVWLSEWMIVATGLLTITVAMPAFTAGKEKMLYAFQGGSDGSNPQSSLVADVAGNLYGTTLSGGGSNNGTVFELMLQTDGKWTEKVLYQFKDLNTGPPNAGLVMDSLGNLYGTTQAVPDNGLFGVAFELSPSRSGWNETTLHTFIGNGDGYGPNNPLIIDTEGNLYGTTFEGGTGGYGIVFELKKANGVWTEVVLHSFSGGRDGSSPEGLAFDASGSLFGLASGGAANRGILFELALSNGHWKKRTLHNFSGGYGGSSPTGNLAFDKRGNVFGSTSAGGGGGCTGGCGVVFKLMLGPHGKWRETVLHIFMNNSHDGNIPLLSFSDGHNLYGVTQQGGRFGVGIIFELLRAFDGSWVERVLYGFAGGRDGANPYALMRDSGKLFGTATQGGENFDGGVFELTP
jgi:uncharacterized repeat protein (TIGR03803 family)